MFSLLEEVKNVKRFTLKVFCSTGIQHNFVSLGNCQDPLDDIGSVTLTSPDFILHRSPPGLRGAKFMLPTSDDNNTAVVLY